MLTYATFGFECSKRVPVSRARCLYGMKALATFGLLCNSALASSFGQDDTILKLQHNIILELYFCTKKIMPFHWQKSNLFIVTFRG
jgi:hypothetical protein